MPGSTPYDTPPPTSPTACSGRPKGHLGDRIFCDNITVEKKTTAKDNVTFEKDLVVKGKSLLEGVTLTMTQPPNPDNPTPSFKFQKVDAQGTVLEETTFLPVEITVPGPLAGVTVTLPDGTATPILPKMKILLALPPTP